MGFLRPPIPKPFAGIRCAAAALAAGLAFAGPLALAQPIRAPGPAATAEPHAWPPVLSGLHEVLIDDPHRGLAEVRMRQRQAGQGHQPDAAIWLDIAAAMFQTLLESDAGAADSLHDAHRRLGAQATPDPNLRAWLTYVELRHRAFTESSAESLRALVEARARLDIREGTLLSCEWEGTEAWLLLEMDSYDEAWRATEALKRCGPPSTPTSAAMPKPCACSAKPSRNCSKSPAATPLA